MWVFFECLSYEGTFAVLLFTLPNRTEKFGQYMGIFGRMLNAGKMPGFADKMKL